MGKLLVTAVFGCVLLVVGHILDTASHSQSGGGYYVIDLSHELRGDTVYWPGNPSLILTILNRGLTRGGFWYESNKFETAEHGGTHLDAPAHFAEGKWRVHEIPPQRLVGPGVVVNVTYSASMNPDYRLNVSDLVAWEREYGAIPDGAIVFMLSGWAARYPDKTLTFNAKNVSDPATFHFPGFHPDAINWLVQHRNISMIGVDTPSQDFGQSKLFEVHQKTAKASIMGLENVNNLDKIPPSGATIVVGVPKLYDGSGAPVRILALVGSKEVPAYTCGLCSNNAGSVLQSYTGSVLVFLLLVLFTQLWMQQHAGGNRR